MSTDRPTREAPWIDPETGTQVWRERDPASGVVTWIWKDPASQIVTESVDGDTIPFERLHSTRGRPGPTVEEIRRRAVLEGLLRARVDEGYSVENAALCAAKFFDRYVPPEGLSDAAYKNDPTIERAREAEKEVADLIRTRHYREFDKIRPDVIPELIWLAAVRVFAVAQIEDRTRALRSVLGDVLASFKGDDRNAVEQNSDRVLNYARDLLNAAESGVT
ncbi:MAG: hypothetical protein ABTQ29_12230 [Siculibacillus sp.]